MASTTNKKSEETRQDKTKKEMGQSFKTKFKQTK